MDVDPTNIVLGVIFVLNAFGLFSVKRDTRQVNNAVNHVESGQPTLSDRVDTISQNIEYVQNMQNMHKHDTELRFNKIESKQDETVGKLESVKVQIEEIYTVLPKRKGDYNGNIETNQTETR